VRSFPGVTELLANRGRPGPRAPQERPGALILPPQGATSGSDLAANTEYAFPFAPGIQEAPVWPVEAWLLGSFQVKLSGALTVPIELQLSPSNELLAVTLALVQSGRRVWSQNLSLKLIPRLFAEGRIFDFSTNVFVDLVNPLRYEAGAEPRFEVSGIVPLYRPGASYETEVLATLREIATELEP
jgi:hypothetical protein